MATGTDQHVDDLPRRSVRSGAVVLVAQSASVGLGVASIAILGRLLTPDDFGVVAMAAAFVALIANFADNGLPQATVQREDINDEQINALFWINALVGAGAALAGVAAAWPIAWFYDRPELVGVTAALAGSLVITGAAAQHQALLRRHMRFTSHSVIAVIATAAGLGAATAAALLGAGYWALVIMAVSNALVRAIGNWIACPWRPSRPRRVAGLGPMIRFGAYLTGTSLAGTIARTTDRILIGRGLGGEAAGFYSNASRLILMPATQLNVPLTSVAIPVLSRLQDEPERFRAFYRRGVEAVAMTLCPLILVGLVAAEHLVPTFLGDQWTESVPILRALAPAALLGCFNVTTSWVYVPLGRSDRQFRWHVFRSICTVASYVIGLRWGAVGVATAFSIQAWLLRLPAVLYCLHGTFVRLTDVGSATWRIGVACVVATAVTAPLAISMRARDDHFVSLVILTAVVFTAYAMTVAVVPGGWSRLRALASTLRHLMPRA